jgi:hypothetical protein
LQRTLKWLDDRGNEVFVIVGPLNEHMLSPTSRQTYRQLTQGVADWLRANQIEYYAPDVLPSDEYADVSHPLPAGYQRLAEQLHHDAAFVRWQDK